MSEADWKLATQTRLGLPAIDPLCSPRFKCTCGAVLKPGSDELHYPTCPSNKNLIIQLHDELRDLVTKFMKRALGADLTYSVDPGATGFTAADGSKVYADIHVQVNRMVYYIDVSWINPSSRAARGSGSLVLPGAAAALREREKERWYSSKVSKEVLSHIVPFAVEATGRLGVQAQNFASVYMAGAPGSTNHFQFKRDVCAIAARYQAKMQKQFMRYKFQAPTPAVDHDGIERPFEHFSHDDDAISVQGDDLVLQEMESDARIRARHNSNRAVQWRGIGPLNPHQPRTSFAVGSQCDVEGCSRDSYLGADLSCQCG